jgi:hypothetical protein
MPGPLVAGIAGSIGSAAIQSSAAKKAGKAQAAAANDQIAETRRQFDLVQSLLGPYVSAGAAGLQAQLDLMGLGGTAGTGPAISEITTGATPGTGGGNFNPFGGLNQTVTPGNPGTTTYRAGDQTFATRAEAEAYAAANMTGAVTAEQAQQNAIDGIAGGAQFGELVKQGEYGILANQSATGGLRGGDTQAAMAQFRPAMLQALIDKQLAQYGGLAANGQNAAAMTGTAAQNAGAQVNQALGDRGAALAGTALAGGQAWANAGSGILNTLGQMAQPTTPGGGAWQRWKF